MQIDQIAGTAVPEPACTECVASSLGTRQAPSVYAVQRRKHSYGLRTLDAEPRLERQLNYST